MTLIVEIKTVYGNEMIYPVNDTAQKFAALIGKKTLNRGDIAIIKELGYTIEVKAKEL